MNEYSPFEVYQRYAIKAAEELRYSDEAVEKIKQAKTENEIRRIMMDARKEFFEQLSEDEKM